MTIKNIDFKKILFYGKFSFEKMLKTKVFKLQNTTVFPYF